LSLKLTKFHKNTLDLWCNALCYICFHLSFSSFNGI